MVRLRPARLCRRWQPHHELPYTSPRLETSSSLAQNLLQPANGKACLHLTSSVIGDVKYFQSWKYMLSTADTPISAEKLDDS